MVNFLKNTFNLLPIFFLLTPVNSRAHGDATNTGNQPPISRGTPERGGIALENLAIGCRASGSCNGSNNRNKLRKPVSGTSNLNCSAVRKQCPRGPGNKETMKLVCNSDYNTLVCVDINLMTDSNGVPQGWQSRNSCKAYCKGQGKRLLTNDEWLVAALGTPVQNCFPKNTTGARGGFDSRNADPLTNRKVLGKQPRPGCQSVYGIKDMIGVLGQWVSDTPLGKPAKFGQFNGGFWGQRKSTIFYRTTAHYATYSDYSIGCRCGARPR